MTVRNSFLMLLTTLLATVAAPGTTAFAEDLPAQSGSPLNLPGLKVAQFDGDDSFDPFADYSEFDEAQDEEEDLNFFHNGRFVTVGFAGGLRGFTDTLGKITNSAPAFGLFLSYFFDLRFAAQLSFLTSDHTFRVVGGGESATGNISMTNWGIDLKYYLNTQNVTKGLAKFNPYLIGGIALIQRTSTINNVSGFSRELTNGFDMGAGIEIPMLRNKMYFGAQMMYQVINFKNENSEITFNDGTVRSGVYPTGDSYTAIGVLGINF